MVEDDEKLLKIIIVIFELLYKVQHCPELTAKWGNSGHLYKFIEKRCYYLSG